MDLPPEILLVNTLKPGTVYLLRDHQFQNGRPHYAVVLNNRITQNSVLYLAIATSQIEGREKYISIRNLPKETLVYTDATECEFLSKKTVFNCNDVLERSVDEVLVKVETAEILSVYQINEELLKRIRDGVLISPLVKRKIKREIDYRE